MTVVVNQTCTHRRGEVPWDPGTRRKAGRQQMHHRVANAGQRRANPAQLGVPERSADGSRYLQRYYNYASVVLFDAHVD